ncbi:hypothetical protein C8R42DRAFT_724777 [Lentinula raphanica]|nr:hypothetical protein C8R42DRAFT_724777 [Lentinula raphanica]
MARQSRRALRALYTFRRSRPTSRADGPGYLYAYVDCGHLWKAVPIDRSIMDAARYSDEEMKGRVVGTSPFGDPVLQQTTYSMSSMYVPYFLSNPQLMSYKAGGTMLRFSGLPRNGRSVTGQFGIGTARSNEFDLTDELSTTAEVNRRVSAIPLVVRKF